MSKVRFQLDLRGLNELMRSDEMQEVLEEYAGQVQGRAEGMSQVSGAEYSHDAKPLRWIAVATVHAENQKALHDNYENNTLLKALGGGA